MTSRDADQIYSCLLKYLRIKTHSIYKVFIMDACEIQQRQLTKCNSKTLLFSTAVFHTFLFLYTVSIWIYFLKQNFESRCSSQQFITKWINCKQTGLLLTKEKYMFCYSCWNCTSTISMISLFISVLNLCSSPQP